MHFKLIVALVEDGKTETIIDAARDAGATGVTVIPNAIGEGLEPRKTFFGLTLETQRDLILLVVEEIHSRKILETVAKVGDFDAAPGTGIAVQLDIEDAVGVRNQVERLAQSVGESI